MVGTVPRTAGLGGTTAPEGSGAWDAEPHGTGGVLALSLGAVRGPGQQRWGSPGSTESCWHGAGDTASPRQSGVPTRLP